MNIRAVLFGLVALPAVILTGCGASYYGYDYADPYYLNPYYGDGIYGGVDLYRYRYSPYYYRYYDNLPGYYGPGYYYRYRPSRDKDDFRRYDRDDSRPYRYRGRYYYGPKFDNYFGDRDRDVRERNRSYLQRRDDIRDRNRGVINRGRNPLEGRSDAIDRFRGTMERNRGRVERSRPKTGDFNRHYYGPKFNTPESGK